MERMNPYEFANLLCIFAQMDGRCADKTIRPRQMSFIEVESASDSTKKYEPICIDDIYVEYLYDRMDARQAAEEAINRIINAKEVVTKKAPEGPKAMNIMNIDSNHVLNILNRIMHDADNIPPDEEPEEPENPVAPVVKPVQPVQIARPSALDDMLSALEDEEEDNTSETPKPNSSEKPDASGDLYNAFGDDDDSDLLSALEEEEDNQDEQKPEESNNNSDNDETEEEPEEAQEEEPSGLSLDESDGENDNAEENQEEKVVAVDIEQEMKDAFAKILNFKYRPSSSEEEEAKEIFDTLVKGASRNFFAKPASIKYDVKEEAKKPVNPNGNVSLGDVIAAALGMPEAGKLDTDTGNTGDDFNL
ncbi:MAG: hypothetical protein ACLSG4_05875 [Anaerobutyricum sp.]